MHLFIMSATFKTRGSHPGPLYHRFMISYSRDTNPAFEELIYDENTFS